MAFPSPIGGVPFPSDFAPSIIFAILYGLLLPVLAYRIIDRKSRNALLIGTTAFAIERLAYFLLLIFKDVNNGVNFEGGNILPASRAIA